MQENTIIPYTALANHERILFRGHIFKNYAFRPHLADSDWFTNFVEFVKRYRLRPVAGAKVEARFNGHDFELDSDERGFFYREFPVDLNGRQVRWDSCQFRLAGRPDWQTGEIMISHPTNVGVVSDIDDTLITSHSTLPLRKFYLMVTRNAHSRHPTPQLHELMESLRGLNDGRMPEDFFYVSDSEWNLYDFGEIFEVHELPKGTFHLRKFQHGFWDALRPDPDTGNTKLDRIDHLFRFYPSKHFILMGDTSQKDMSIYATIARRYEQRVKGILIRKVKRAAAPSKIDRYTEIYRELKLPFQVIS